MKSREAEGLRLARPDHWIPFGNREPRDGRREDRRRQLLATLTGAALCAAIL